MILTVTLNPAIDESIEVVGFQVGGVHHVRRVTRRPGGKGVNVARALSCLGHEVVAAGLCGGAAGELLLRGLDEEGIACRFLPISGPTRVNRTIVDPEGGGDTHLIEDGPAVEDAEWRAFLELFGELLGRAELVALAGSLPRGLDESAYAHLVETARRAGVASALDTRGEALRRGEAARPDILKPNAEELAELCGVDPSDEAAVAAAARDLAGEDRTVMVTLGRDGAVLAAPSGSWRARIPPVPAVNTVGSGDAALAGLVSARLRGSGPEDALALAMGCGMANASSDGPGRFDPAEARRLARLVEITPL